MRPARVHVLFSTVAMAVLAVLAAGCATTPSVYSGPRPGPYSGPDPGPELNWAEAARAIEGIAGYRFGQSREPLAVVHGLVRDAMFSADSSARLAAMLGASLEGRATVDAKRFVCRELSLIGGAAEVPQLTSLLTNPEIADSARYALDRIPSDG